jgi:hypothetical protein
MPQQAPGAAPEGRGHKMGSRQREGRMPQQAPEGAPEGRGPSVGSLRHVAYPSFLSILAVFFKLSI